MAHVFISYAHTDHVYARKLADYLLANGFDVWIDDRIDFGSRWVRSIFESVDSCSAFVLVMTPRSNDSEFVEKEYLRAADQKKPTFPLLLEGRSFAYFGGIQYYDVQDGALPGQNFLDRLAKFAAPSGVGQDVTAPAVVQNKSTPSPDATGEYLTAPPQAVSESSTAETKTQAVSMSPPQRRGSLLIGAMAVVLVVVIIVFAALFIHPPNRAAGTPTLTQIGEGTGAANDPTNDNSGIGTNIAAPTLPLSPATDLPATASMETDAPGATTPDPYGQIAFQSDRDGTSQIYTMDTDGSNIERLTNDFLGDTEPAWSPDGSQIMFVSAQNDNSELYVIDADGGNLRKLAVNVGGWNPAWSPDGTQVAFTGYGNSSVEIFVVDVTGGDAKPLTSDSTNDDFACWSPDGTQIAFASHQDGNDEIYVMDADGSHVKRLTNDPAQDIAPAWSPDGTQIAFQSSRDGDAQVYVMNADGTQPHPLTNAPVDGYTPRWSPDGTQIVFMSYRNGNDGEIYVMDADGGNVRRLTDNSTADDNPTWRP